MNRKTKTIMAFLTAMSMTAGAMGTTAYAEEINESTYSYSLEDRNKIKATPEMQPVIELKSNEMKQYLLENNIIEDIADKVVSEYANAVSKLIYFGSMGENGEEDNQLRDDSRKFCLEIAQLIMKNDPANEPDIEHKLYQLSIAYIPYNGPKRGPAQAAYGGEKLPSNDCVLREGVEFHYSPETNVIVLDGSGFLTNEDKIDISKTTEKTNDQGFRVDGYTPTLIIGKNVELTDIMVLTNPRRYRTYIYKDSPMDMEYQKLCDWHEQHRKDMAAIGVTYTGGGSDELEVHYIDDSTDPYDILSGKVDITAIEQPVSDATDETEITVETNEVSEEAKKVKVNEVKVLAEKPASTMKGDADVNNEVGLSDVITVAKYNLNNELYPLENETAFANADMNSDGEVNGVDTSALIENQLGKK